jgi:hypothetical protein
MGAEQVRADAEVVAGVTLLRRAVALQEVAVALSQRLQFGHLRLGQLRALPFRPRDLQRPLRGHQQLLDTVQRGHVERGAGVGFDVEERQSDPLRDIRLTPLIGNSVATVPRFEVGWVDDRLCGYSCLRVGL